MNEGTSGSSRSGVVAPTGGRAWSARLAAPRSPLARRLLWGGGAAPFPLLAEAAADRHGPVPLWLDTPFDLAPQLGTTLDYAVFADLAARAAGVLAAAGIRVGDVVAILKQPNVDVVALALAAARLGAVPALVAPDFSPDVTRTLLARLQPALTITDRATLAACAGALDPRARASDPGAPGAVHVVDAPDAGSLDLPSLDDVTIPPVRPRGSDELLAITHTSGTTGTPKLIGHTTDSLAGQSAVQVLGGRLLLGRRDVVATCLTSAHARTLSGLATMAAVGAPHLALVNPDPASAGPLLARHRPTLVETFPNVFLRWEQLAHDPAGPLRNVRIFLSTFDAAHPRAIRTMLAASHRRFPIYAQAYAQSELGAIALSFRSRRTVENDARDVGLPALAFSRVRVHDPTTGRRLPPGMTGILRVRSPGLFGGYVGQPELTATQQQDGWWDTGDMGSRSRIGRIRLAGRVVDAVDGQPEYLAWEDVLLDRLPELTELVLLDGRGGNPQPVLCTREDAPLDQERWTRATCDLPDLLAPQQLPWSALPTTATWKVRRHALRELLGLHASARPPSRPLHATPLP